jgi:hypothetical protein
MNQGRTLFAPQNYAFYRSKIMINLTMLVILEEVDNVLALDEICAEYGGVDFDDLRQNLISYTAKRVRSRFRPIPAAERWQGQPTALEEHLNVEQIVLEGVQHLCSAGQLDAPTLQSVLSA